MMAQLCRADIFEGAAVEVEIEDYGFTGEGFVRLADGWLSVFGALPGERVIVQVQPGQRAASRRLYADIKEVLVPSKLRREPLCEFASRCRGCQLRHLTVAEELRFKARTVREVVERYGGLAASEQPEVEIVTPQPISRGDAFRIRSQLSYRRRGDSFELGLYSPVASALIPMQSCAALTQPVQRLINTIDASLQACRALPWDQEMVRDVSAQVEGIELMPGLRSISVVAPTHGVGLVDVELTPVGSEEHFLSALRAESIGGWLGRLAEVVPEQVGVAVHSDGQRRIIKGPERIRLPILGWRLEVGFEDWFHTSIEPAEAVYEHLLHWLEPSKEDRFLDVGCGMGTIALLLADHVGSVVGLDQNRASIAAAEINALSRECENTRFVAGGWEKGLRRFMMAGERFDLATINPMREPLGRRTLALFHSLGVRRLVYLGPSPEAAARDIGVLREMGWQVDRLAAANLHPGTYHTFLMAALTNDAQKMETAAADEFGDGET